MLSGAVLVGLLSAVLPGSILGGTAAEGQLEVTVTEGGAGPIPCRVHLAAGGTPVYIPGMPRFERDPHFCCPGRFTAAVPPGKVQVLIERGLEYLPFSTEIDVAAGQTVERRVELVRWIDMNPRGWFSGDLHVHRPPADMPLLLRADDLNLAPVLTFWNKTAAAVAPPYLVDGRDEGATPRPRCFHILAQEDERAGGAILLFNLAKPIILDGVTRDCPSGFVYHEAALGQKAFVDLEKPFWWEAPVHVALGRVDSIGLVCNHFQRTRLMDNEAWGRPRDRAVYAGPPGFARNVMDLYYRYLNLGCQIAASAGSATGVLANPLGRNRVYVPLERFSYDAWFAALREGRNFVTNGPMLFATVNGRPVGTRFEAPAGSFEARVEFEVLGRDPLEKAEIVVGGEVAASFAPEADNPRRIAARHDLRIGRSTWIALRAFEPVRNSVVRFAHTSPFYVTIGNARPRDPDAARFYVRWIDELIDATEKKQAAAGNPAPFDSVLAAYRRARAVYQAAATSAEGVLPGASADAEAAWARISAFFRPPAELADDLGAYRSPLLLDDGRRAETPADWQKRREEILRCWHGQMGPWPPLVEKPRLEELETTAREGFTQKKVRLAAATDLAIEGYLLVPPGDAPRPAVLVVYYDAESGAGLNPKSPLRDFGYALTKRGFVSLSIGWPREYTDARGPRLQPLSCLAYIAANCWGAMAARPEVDGRRIGVVGHSFGGKWALFAGALWQKFACVAVSDPGIVFDEARANVNYWEPWYLGAEEGVKRGRGLVTAQNPRTGAYKRLMEAGRDLHELHALIAPRPLLVSGGAEDSPSRWKALNHAVAVNRMLGQENRVAMTNRQGHSPTEESNEQLYLFFEYFLKHPQAPAPAGK